jgi:adenylosuccinate synthase
MPVSVVVGGQYGSEGKGKVALEMVRRDPSIAAVVRPGGTNSGHTGYDRAGRKVILRQFPAAAIDGDITVIFSAGSYIDPVLFLAELKLLNFPEDRIFVDRRAHVILDEHKQAEAAGGLVEAIGSTGSGTGASVISRIGRYAPGGLPAMPAEEHPDLARFVRDVPALLADMLDANRRVLIEGTQGFGLSVLHGESWPHVTSRDTIASGFLSESGLAPIGVDEIVLVLRTFPIRVAGDSGPLIGETTWGEVEASSGSRTKLREFTSVTNKLRRVGRFDPNVVRQAIRANRPTRIVLNHVDYVDADLLEQKRLSPKAVDFVADVGEAIGQRVTDVGTGPTCLFAVLAPSETRV